MVHGRDRVAHSQHLFDELNSANPASLAELSPAELRAALLRTAGHLMAQAGQLTALAAALLDAQPPAGDVDRLVPLDEAAARLNWKMDYAYRHWREADGFVKDRDGRVKIAASRLAKYIARAGR
jgi:hypothetical protein